MWQLAAPTVSDELCRLQNHRCRYALALVIRMHTDTSDRAARAAKGGLIRATRRGVEERTDNCAAMSGSEDALPCLEVSSPVREVLALETDYLLSFRRVANPLESDRSRLCDRDRLHRRIPIRQLRNQVDCFVFPSVAQALEERDGVRSVYWHARPDVVLSAATERQAIVSFGPSCSRGLVEQGSANPSPTLAGLDHEYLQAVAAASRHSDQSTVPFGDHALSQHVEAARENRPAVSQRYLPQAFESGAIFVLLKGADAHEHAGGRLQGCLSELIGNQLVEQQQSPEHLVTSSTRLEEGARTCRYQHRRINGSPS
jgi:hypothetical protein